MGMVLSCCMKGYSVMSSFYRCFMGVLILPLKLTVKNPRFVYF